MCRVWKRILFPHLAPSPFIYRAREPQHHTLSISVRFLPSPLHRGALAYAPRATRARNRVVTTKDKSEAALQWIIHIYIYIYICSHAHTLPHDHTTTHTRARTYKHIYILTNATISLSLSYFSFQYPCRVDPRKACQACASGGIAREQCVGRPCLHCLAVRSKGRG